MTDVSRMPSDRNARPQTAIVVGAGPVGIEVAVAMKQAGLDVRVFDSGPVGATLCWWPPLTQFFSSPERIAICGVPIQSIDQTKITGEAYLAYLRAVIQQFRLEVNTFEGVESIEAQDGRFTVAASGHGGPKSYESDTVVLCTGGLARPRMLGIPGEDLPHVSHYVGNPHVYFQRRLLIVGGLNSAIEAALRCWRVGCDITISHRRPELNGDRIKPHLFGEIRMLIREGKIGYLPSTTPVAIARDHVALAPTTADFQPRPDGHFDEPADSVLLCTGFMADMGLFTRTGVRLDGERQVPAFDAATMETNVPRLFVAGTAVGGTQHRFKSFIETSHGDAARILLHLGHEPPAWAREAMQRPVPVSKESSDDEPQADPAGDVECRRDADRRGSARLTEPVTSEEA